MTGSARGLLSNLLIGLYKYSRKHNLGGGSVFAWVRVNIFYELLDCLSLNQQHVVPAWHVLEVLV